MTEPAAAPSAQQESPPKASSKRRSLGDILSFVAQRLLFGVLVLLFIIFLSYLGIDMASGTPLGPAISQALPRSATYIGRLFQGEMGMTPAGSDTLVPLPVTQVLAERLPRTLGLLGISILLATVVGVGLGTIAARARSDRSIWIILSTLIGVSIPSFFAAFLLQWGVTALTRQLGRRILPVGGFGWDNHLILPMLVLAARPIAQITRITYVSLQSALQEDYVRTARSKGLYRYQIIAVHVIRNAAIPILTTIGISLRFSLSSLPLVEYYFGWPGVGAALLKGIARQDINLTVGLALCLGVLFILVNLLLELSYRLIDPRLMDSPSDVRTGERQTLLSRLKFYWASAVDMLTHNALTNWIRRRRQGDSMSGLRPLSADAPPPGKTDDEADLPTKPDPEWRQALRNVPLLLGGILVLGLVLFMFFGPLLAPRSPFNMQGLTTIDGQLTAPPFPPGDDFLWGSDPLGRDLMSLIFSGAQQTLVLAVLAVAARTLVGVILGAIAGWTEGSRLDRFILSFAEVISAFPTLLLAMILILAFGIRGGMPPFIIALCFVGWGEIMQFVRSQVISIRPRPYIESAVAVGARTPRIIGRHILPHLFSALISIIALEMGAVLMLLGELGFIGIFIGGGTRLAHDTATMLYSDIPEWGALLSNVRTFARSYPWTGLVPTMAFFVAILSFNLFGEGFRRSIEKGHIVFSRLINRYTVTFAVVAIVAFNWLSDNSGSMPFFKRSASEFDSSHVMEHMAVLTDPAMEGRALGSGGIDAAADYIAAEFEALGLQPAGELGTFFQERDRAFETLDTTPEFTIYDDGPDPILGQDFAAYPGLNATSGEADCPMRFMRLGPAIQSSPSTGWRHPYPDLEHADFSGETLVVLSGSNAIWMTSRTGCGMIVIAPEGTDLSRRYTLSGRSGMSFDFDWNRVGQEKPYLWISHETAERLLALSDIELDELLESTTNLGSGEVFNLPLEGRAAFSMHGTIHEKVPVRNIMGYLPGWHGYDHCVDCLGKRAILVLVQYDSPPIGSDGVVYPAANDNASGVAVMLELIRLIQETDYSPPKTFYFAAYSGEGLDHGEPIGDPPDVNKLLQARPALLGLEIEAIVLIRGVGAGSGERVEISAGGSLRLAQLLERAARHMDARLVRAEEAFDISVIYYDLTSFSEVGMEAPTISTYWEGWEQYSRLPEDTLEIISEENLDHAGRTLALALMILGQEINY
jgi:ABC-type dipeptide/oligopeptide/nickel transport system permease component